MLLLWVPAELTSSSGILLLAQELCSIVPLPCLLFGRCSPLSWGAVMHLNNPNLMGLKLPNDSGRTEARGSFPFSPCFFVYAFHLWLLEELHYVKTEKSLPFVSSWNNFRYLRHPIWQRSCSVL